MVREKDIKEWYNQRHLRLGEEAWRPFEAYPVFLDYLQVQPGGRLLDVGCGTGYLLQEADRRGLQTYGVDISEEGVKIARRISPNSQIRVGQGEDLEYPDGYFDYITCIGALEHFLDIGKGLQEFGRVAQNRALLCVVVPNSHFLFWKVRGTKGTEQRTINEQVKSLSEWADVLRQNGFEIVRTVQDRGLQQSIKVFSSRDPLKILKMAILKAIWFFIPLKFTYQFVFILKKNSERIAPININEVPRSD